GGTYTPVMFPGGGYCQYIGCPERVAGDPDYGTCESVCTPNQCLPSSSGENANSCGTPPTNPMPQGYRAPVIKPPGEMGPDRRYRDLCVRGAMLTMNAFDTQTGELTNLNEGMQPESISDSLPDSSADTPFSEKFTGNVAGARPIKNSCMP